MSELKALGCRGKTAGKWVREVHHQTRIIQTRLLCRAGFIQRKKMEPLNKTHPSKSVYRIWEQHHRPDIQQSQHPVSSVSLGRLMLSPAPNSRIRFKRISNLKSFNRNSKSEFLNKPKPKIVLKYLLWSCFSPSCSHFCTRNITCM